MSRTLSTSFPSSLGLGRAAQGPTASPASALPAGDSASPSPEALATKCQAGSHEAFAALVQLFHERIFRYLFHLTGNRQDAEDLTQETFLKAYTGMLRYSPNYSLATWLFTIAKRTASSHFRSLRVHEPLPEEDQCCSPAADPASSLAARDEQDYLWEAARRLKPKQFEALWLRYGEGFSVAEVARIMGANLIYVKVLLHRGRNALARRFHTRAHPPGVVKP